VDIIERVTVARAKNRAHMKKTLGSPMTVRAQA